jgi:hypothetical protein
MKRLILCLLLTACAPAPLAPASALTAPENATRIAVTLPSVVAFLEPSPDRKRVAYTTTDALVHVATIGGGEATSQVQGTVQEMTWVEGGTALICRTVEPQPGPGPAAGTMRLVRVPTTGGAGVTLATAQDVLWYSAAGSTLLYEAPGQDDVTRLDLATGKTSASVRGRLSPSALRLVIPGGQPRVRELDTGEEAPLPSDLAGNPQWLDDDRLLVVDGTLTGRFQVVPRGGTPDPVRTVDVDPASIAFPGPVSPDGHYALGAGKGKDPGSPLIDLTSGHVAYTNSFAWRGWWDATTLYAVDAGGLYTVPLAQATAR